MQKEEGPSLELSPQDTLKTKLLAGHISPLDFIHQVLYLDQKVPTRDHAEANIRLLTDPTVLALLESDSSLAFDLYNTLSLSFFHAGQRRLLSGKLYGDEFEQALRAAKKIPEEGYEQWKKYIEATIAYIKKDVASLERFVQEMEDGENKNIVLNMILGIKQYNNIDYQRDYSNIPPK